VAYQYATYRDGKRVADGTISIGDAAAARRDNQFVWLELVGPDASELSELHRRFDLPELAIEDAAHAHQRPKFDEYPHCLFVVLRTARYHEGPHECELGEIHIFLGTDYIVVVRHGGDPADLDEIRARAERHSDLMRLGPTSVLYAVVDEVVDDYEPVLEGISNDVETVETDVFALSVHDVTERIYKLKREVLELRRAVSPLVLPHEKLIEGRFHHVPEQMKPYFRDVHDHLKRAEDRVESLRELLTGALEANVALVTVRQNEIVQKISGWAAVIAVPTLISGIYGMNFKHMPELDWTYGYPYALALMLALASLLYLLLRRAQWL
jgi:magnesium transporter